MEQNEFDEIMAELNQLQDKAMDDRRKYDSNEMEMYFSGKDIGLAQAKALLREAFDGSDEEAGGVQSSFERGSTDE